MTTLNRSLRKDLENAVRKARRAAEVGARKSVEQLGVHHYEAWPSLTPAHRELRNRLRAHGRQLGDRRDERGRQTIDRLVAECAYEHWHRMLFARFLAESDLLIEPTTEIPLTLNECRELALERGADWLTLASGFAASMLPQIFRPGDPVLEVPLPPETRQELEQILKDLPSAIFVADDSLGWVYQFWQAEEKDVVNKSERKIGAEELPAVTQLFTDDYMVLFLLHNTLGAWWAGKVLATRPDIAANATSEEDVRSACSVDGIDWTYLRFVRSDADGRWRPAAGSFEGWPPAAKDITVLDPCMGSGHFLVVALRILVALRMNEEGVSLKDALRAVLSENLFGLEIDSRCTQIAAFNLALGAWRVGGHQPLPRLNLACSGLGINAREEEWTDLAGSDARAQSAMKKLYALFGQAPTLGSLIDPKSIGGDLFAAEFENVQPLLERALATEASDDAAHEMAVAARGVIAAARILVSRYTLVATNVPFLGREKQAPVLQDYLSVHHGAAKADLACAMYERCLRWISQGGAVAIVSPQYWLFLKRYKPFRQEILRRTLIHAVMRLGPGAFDSITGEVVNACLTIVTANGRQGRDFVLIDAGDRRPAVAKAEYLKIADLMFIDQARQLTNHDSIIGYQTDGPVVRLDKYAYSYQGLATSDNAQFVLTFWEVPALSRGWEPFQMAPAVMGEVSGCSWALHWEGGAGRYFRHTRYLKEAGRLGGWKSGHEAWGSRGIAVNRMGDLPAAPYTGAMFDCNVAVVIPKNQSELRWMWRFMTSPDYSREVRRLNQKASVTNLTLVKVPVDKRTWEELSGETGTAPRLETDDPTQWLFDGHPRGSGSPLHVAVARLLGYRWPRQTGTKFADCALLSADGLEHHAPDDGIVCLTPLRGEEPAAERLRRLLAEAFGSEWSAARQNGLLGAVGFEGRSLDDWLRNGFFEQHCELFHQRPFIWHIWDGVQGGFAALVNYHKIAGPDGEGRRTLEKLVFSYLGDWVDRQRNDQTSGVEGADARLAAAQHLKRELERVLEGEPPYDLFVRWKPLHEQPIGWAPDANDGVRINIRPFVQGKPLGGRSKNACILRVTPRIKWEKDRGKEPERPRTDYPWFWEWDGQTIDFRGGRNFDGSRWTDLHYTRQFKEAARRSQCPAKGAKQ